MIPIARPLLRRLAPLLWFLLTLPIASAQISFVGIGVQFHPEPHNGFPVIRRVLRDSPAAAAGLRPDEVLWSVDGLSLSGKSIAEVTALIKGDAGLRRTLVVGTDQRTITLELARIRGRCTDGDCENGEGRLEEPDGSVYVGAFAHGRFEGWANYVTADGNRYEAHFHDGLPDGEGKYFDYQRGYIYRGNFKAGRFDGDAKVEIISGGAIYTGPFANHRPAGEGVLTFANGTQRSLNPADFAALLAAAKAAPPAAPASGPAPATKAPPARTLGIDADKADDPDPFAAFVAQQKRIEQKITDVLDAYPGFRAAFKAGLDRHAGRGEDAAREAVNELERVVRPWGEASKLLTSISKTVDASVTMNERQQAAMQAWFAALKPIIDQMKQAKVDEKYTADGYYWMNMNVEAMRAHLAEAQRHRREF